MNGTAIAGATGQTFDLSTAGHGDHGEAVGVDVTANSTGWTHERRRQRQRDGRRHGSGEGSGGDQPGVSDGRDDADATPSAFTDADGDALTCTYAWFRNDQRATTSTLPAS